MQAVPIHGTMGRVRGAPDEMLHSLVLRGKLRTSVRYITKREKGGVMQPGGTCTTTGEPVLGLLQ